MLTRRISPGAGARARAQAQRADVDVADAQLDALHAGGAREQRLLVRGRARRDGERLARAVEHDDARVEHARGGAHDGGQPGPGLDGRSDLVEGGEVQRVRHERTTIRS